MQLKVARVYDSVEDEGCLRVLAERLWPRGISKEELKVDLWPRDLAPSDGLRRWFSHDPAKWEEFKRRYFEELEVKEGLVQELCEAIRSRGCAVLLYSARDREHNSAVALAEYLSLRCAGTAAPKGQ